MREIKFRGWSKGEKKWVYGYYAKERSMNRKRTRMYSVIMTFEQANDYENLDVYIVNPSSIGQYTGLKDINGNEIYVGDILSLNGETNMDTTCCGYITEYNGMYVSFYGQDINGKDCFDILYTVSKEREIIGNIHKNPELLEVTE